MNLHESEFFFKTNSHEFQSIIITGARRSGKSLLGNILATCNEVEYSEEPYPIMSFPLAVKKGGMDMRFASMYLNTQVVQLFIESILLRNANFRVRDLSSIWTKKTPEKILNRITQVKTTAEAWDYIKRNNSSFVMTLPEVLPFLNIFDQALPRVKFINVVRNGFDVASDVAQKCWYTNDRFERPETSNCYRIYNDYRKWYLPWWVKHGDEDVFLNYNIYEKALYYWLAVNRTSSTSKVDQKNVLVVNYDDLVCNPMDQLRTIFKFASLEPAELSQSEIDKINKRPVLPERNNIDSELRKLIIDMNLKLGI
ncbi:sulfotransferase [Alphaproteobacteria bacterium]|nr:sulfotransferase [Alphaproteobacteria bacterium]MDC1157100.1 sulfotransferase [Alphaproteobacteria bacterium]